MFSPYGGAAPKRVLPRFFGQDLWAGKEYIFWRASRPYPDLHLDLHCLRTSDNHHTVVPDYTAPGPPTECSSRLYWAELSPESENPSRPVRIFSANIDGTGRRLEFAPGKDDKYLCGYGVHKDRIYVVLSDVQEPQRSRARPSYWLAELDSSGNANPRIIDRLPGNFSGEPEFDEEYLYYYRPISRGGLFDWIGSQRRFRLSLQRYRVRLPG